MGIQTTGETAEINLSVTVPLAELDLMAGTLKNVLTLAGHKVRLVNDEGDEMRSADEVFSEAHPGMTLRGFRLRDDMTQEELAERLGIKQAGVSALESGQRPISVAMAKRLGEIFEITHHAFLRYIPKS
jgi:DNA-binding XRE family transcriptional regulator